MNLEQLKEKSEEIEDKLLNLEEKIKELKKELEVVEYWTNYHMEESSKYDDF